MSLLIPINWTPLIPLIPLKMHPLIPINWPPLIISLIPLKIPPLEQ